MTAERQAPRAPYVAWFVAVAAVLALGLLVNPPIPPQFEKWRCVNDVELGGPFRVLIICDSWAFMDLAHDPSRLLRPRSLRQSRPGMILVATLPTALLSMFFGETRPTAYAAYMLAHAAIMAACLAIFLAIVRPPAPSPSPAVLGLSLLLLFNTVTYEFLLSPLTCLLHILAPLFCLWVARDAWTSDLLASRRVFPMALLAGVGFTAYGSFALFLPALLLPAAVRTWQRHGSPRTFLRRATAVVALVLAPITAWYALVVARTGTIYNPEVEIYRLWVWMIDDYHRDGAWAVVTKLGALTWVFARQAIKLGAPPVILGVAVLLLARPPQRRLLRGLRPEVVPTALVVVITQLADPSPPMRRLR